MPFILTQQLQFFVRNSGSVKSVWREREEKTKEAELGSPLKMWEFLNVFGFLSRRPDANREQMDHTYCRFTFPHFKAPLHRYIVGVMVGSYNNGAPTRVIYALPEDMHPQDPEAVSRPSWCLK